MLLTIMERIFPIFNLLLYWSPGIMQSLSFLYEVNKCILSYDIIPYQGTIDPLSHFYDPPHKLYLPSLPVSDHLAMTRVHVYMAPSEDGLLIFDTYVSTLPTRVDSFSLTQKINCK